MFSKKPLFSVYSPHDGQFVEQKQINDPVFAGTDMGVGCGVTPNGGDSVEFLCPVKGTVSLVYETGHAYYVSVCSGELDFFIHFGIDTVQIPMSEKVFSPQVEVEQVVTEKNPIVKVDVNKIVSIGKDPISVLLVQGESVAKHKVEYFVKHGESVKTGDLLFSVY